MNILRYGSVVIGLMILSPGFIAYSGNLDSPAAPTSTSSAMYSLRDIYNRLDTGSATAKRTGAFTEPTAGPTAGTGHTLDEIMAKAPSADNTNGATPGEVTNSKTFWCLRTDGSWGLKTGSLLSGTGTTYSAGVPKTGQTTSYSATTGEDGDLQKGVTWPNPRFTDNSNGTVTDNLTGLVWLKNANAFGSRNWEQALSDANALASGSSGLTDGSVVGDWRLPHRKEIYSLIDLAYANPALSNASGTSQWTEGNPFTGVRSYPYWSSSSRDSAYAWTVDLDSGFVFAAYKPNATYVWPVRAGQ